jgi:hypothetical protein
LRAFNGPVLPPPGQPSLQSSIRRDGTLWEPQYWLVVKNFAPVEDAISYSQALGLCAYPTFESGYAVDRSRRRSRFGGTEPSRRSLLRPRMMVEHATLPNMKGAAATSLEGAVQEIDQRKRVGKWPSRDHASSILKSAGSIAARTARS